MTARRPASFFALRIRVDGMLSSWLLLLALATPFAFLDRFCWLGEIAVSFQRQYLVAALVMGIVFVLRRRRAQALICLLLAVANGVCLLPSGGARIAEPAVAPRVRVMVFNVFTSNTNHQEVVNAIERHAPDIVVLQEVDERWMEAMTPALPNHRAAFAAPRDDNFGLAVFSALPVLLTREVFHAVVDTPTVELEIESPSGVFVLLAAHLLPPGSPLYTRIRNEQLRDLAASVRAQRHPVLLVGDLNAVPWSRALRTLLRDARLRRAGCAIWPPATWPAPLGPLGIPIDHAFHTEGIQIETFRTVSSIGSDHLPLVVDFRVH